MLRGDLVADVRYLALPLMQLTCGQLKCWLQPIEFERFQLLSICWRTKQPFPLVFATEHVTVPWLSFLGRRGKRVKNWVSTRCSYKMIPWPSFRFTLPLIPKREHFLYSIWWTDRAMSIYLHDDDNNNNNNNNNNKNNKGSVTCRDKFSRWQVCNCSVAFGIYPPDRSQIG